MKKIKKILAMVLAMAMVLGMSMTTFAAPDGEADEETTATVQKTTVTVQNLIKDAEVTYVKIVDLDNSKTGWKLLVDNVGMTLDEIIQAIENEANIDDAASAGVINPTLTSLDFSKVDTDPSTEEVAGDDGKVKFENMTAGLYAIKAVDPSNEYRYSWMVAYVGYDNGTIQPVVVTAKGAQTKITKDVVNAADGSVAKGEEVEYTVTVPYPVFATGTEAGNRSFKITDTVANGTFKKDSVIVDEKWGLSPAEEYEGKSTVVLTLDSTKYDPSLAGQDITITYTIVVGDVSTNAPLKNEITSEIEEKPVSKAIVITPSVDVEVTKTDEDGEKIEATATFALYKVADENTTGAEEITVEGGTTVWAVLVDTQSTVDGVAKFESLDAEDELYYVKETIAPEGYSLQEEAYPLSGAALKEDAKVETETIDGVITTTTTYEVETGFTSVGFKDGLNFHDTNLSSLPSTGGIGTTIFTIGGCALMILAAALYFMSRRKSAK